MGDVSFGVRMKIRFTSIPDSPKKDGWILDHYMIRNVLIRIAWTGFVLW